MNARERFRVLLLSRGEGKNVDLWFKMLDNCGIELVDRAVLEQHETVERAARNLLYVGVKVLEGTVSAALSPRHLRDALDGLEAARDSRKP